MPLAVPLRLAAPRSPAVLLAVLLRPAVLLGLAALLLAAREVHVQVQALVDVQPKVQAQLALPRLAAREAQTQALALVTVQPQVQAQAHAQAQAWARPELKVPELRMLVEVSVLVRG